MVMEDSDAWAAEAISRLRLDGPGPTPLCSLVLPAGQGIGIHARDESAHPAGSVKCRLVRAMFREAVAGGAIKADTPVVVAVRRPGSAGPVHGCPSTAKRSAVTPRPRVTRLDGERPLLVGASRASRLE
ncbi:hypothetical protein ACFCV8_29425 [Streptomyces sp. NPDC056347]|uniref:hypothetical protein n=1 Tax=Streptomyces sp. NPDC056347 TaxID=3345790 RepID=UPI0035DBC5A5